MGKREIKISVDAVVDAIINKAKAERDLNELTEPRTIEITPEVNERDLIDELNNLERVVKSKFKELNKLKLFKEKDGSFIFNKGFLNQKAFKNDEKALEKLDRKVLGFMLNIEKYGGAWNSKPLEELLGIKLDDKAIANKLNNIRKSINTRIKTLSSQSEQLSFDDATKGIQNEAKQMEEAAASIDEAASKIESATQKLQKNAKEQEKVYNSLKKFKKRVAPVDGKENIFDIPADETKANVEKRIGYLKELINLQNEQREIEKELRQAQGKSRGGGSTYFSPNRYLDDGVSYLSINGVKGMQSVIDIYQGEVVKSNKNQKKKKTTPVNLPSAYQYDHSSKKTSIGDNEEEELITASPRDVERMANAIRQFEVELNKLGNVDGIDKLNDKLSTLKEIKDSVFETPMSKGDLNGYFNQFQEVSNLLTSNIKTTKKTGSYAYDGVSEFVYDNNLDSSKIRDYYETLINYSNQINSINKEIMSMQSKDKGSGFYDGQIKALQARKNELVDAVKETFSSFQGKDSTGWDINVPFVFGEDTQKSIGAFLNTIKGDAGIAKSEVDALTTSLEKMINVEKNSANDKVNKLFGLHSTIDSAQLLKQKKDGSYPQAVQEYISAMQALNQFRSSDRFSNDITQMSTGDLAYYDKLISYAEKSGQALIKYAAAEKQYFANKRQYIDGDKYSEYTQQFTADKKGAKVSDVEMELRKVAESFTDGKQIITDFTQSANGISSLNFSVFDDATGKLRNFTVAMGKASEQVSIFEHVDKSGDKLFSNGIQQLNEVSAVFKKLSDSGMDKGSKYYENIASIQEVLRSYITGDNIDKNNTAWQNGLKDAIAQSKLDIREAIKALEEYKLLQESIAKGETTVIGSKGSNSNSEYVLRQNVLDYGAALDGVAVKVGKFNSATNTLKFTMTDAAQTTKTMEASINQFGQVVVKQEGTLTTWKTRLESLKTNLSSTAGQFGKYLIGGGTGMMAVVSQFKKGFEYVKTIDSAMTELKKVTDETESTYSRFLNTMSSIAPAIGSTVDGLVQSAADWARLGYSIDEAGEMAKNTAILMNVSEFTDVSKATDSLIASMKAYHVEAEDSMNIIDSLNAVGNNYAISTSDAADSLTRSAASLYAAGNTFNESLALTAAANTFVQNPESVGTALKTLSMRIRGTKVELEEMGEDTDGMAESTSKLRAQIAALTAVNGNKGFDILDDNGDYKSTYDILVGIGKVWKDISNIDQAALLELVAGKRQGSIIAGILEEPQLLEDVYKTAEDSAGSAMVENSKYINSIEGKINQLKSTTETMWVNALNSNAVKFFVDLGTSITSLVDKIGLIPVALGTVMTVLQRKSKINLFESLFGVKSDAGGRSGGILQFFKNRNEAKRTFSYDTSQIGDITGRFNQFNELNGDNRTRFVQEAKNMTEAEKAYFAQLKNGKATMADFNAFLDQQNEKMGKVGISSKLASLGMGLFNMGLNIAIGVGISAAISGLTSLANHYQEVADNANKAADKYKESTDKYKSNNETIKDIGQELDRLSQGVDSNGNNIGLSSAEFERYHEITNQIADMFPDMVAGYDSESNAILKIADASKSASANLNDMNESLKRSANVELLNSGRDINENTKNAIVGATDLAGAWQSSFGRIGSSYDMSDAIDALRIIKRIESGEDIDSVLKDYDNYLGGKNNGVNLSGVRKYISSLGIEDPYASQRWLADAADYITGGDEENRKYLKTILSNSDNLKTIKNQGKAQAAQVNEVVKQFTDTAIASLEENDAFKQLSDEGQTIMKNMIGEITYEDLWAKFGSNGDYSYAALATEYMENFSEALSDPNVLAKGKNISEQSAKFLSGNITYGEYQNAYNAFIKSIDGYSDDQQDKLKSYFVPDMEDVQEDINAIQSKYKNIKVDEDNNPFKSWTNQEITIAANLELKSKYGNIDANTLHSLAQQYINDNGISKYTAMQSYDDLLTKVEDYNNAMAAANSITMDNTELTEDQKDVLSKYLGDLKKYDKAMDTSTGGVVKNTDALKEAVKQTRLSTLADIESSRAQAQLQYQDLLYQLGDLATAKWDDTDASYDQITSLLEQMETVESTIAQYQMLEVQLLGTASAYKKYQDATTFDEATDYGSRLTTMFNSLKDGFENGKIGSETFKAAVEALVPSEEYITKTGTDRLDAIYDYAENTLSKYFTIDDKGISIDLDSINRFQDDLVAVNNGLKESDQFLTKGSSVDSWEFNSTASLDSVAEHMNLTKEALFDLLDAYADYNVDWDNPMVELAANSADATDQLWGNQKKLADYYAELARLRKENKDGSNDDAIAEAKANISKTEAEVSKGMDRIRKEIGQKGKLETEIETIYKETGNREAFEKYEQLRDSGKTEKEAKQEIETEFKVDASSYEDSYNKIETVRQKISQLDSVDDIEIEMLVNYDKNRISNIDEEIASLKSQIEQDPSLKPELTAKITKLEAEKGELQGELDSLAENYNVELEPEVKLEDALANYAEDTTGSINTLVEALHSLVDTFRELNGLDPIDWDEKLDIDDLDINKINFDDLNTKLTQLGDEWNALSNGNVDYNKRPVIAKQQMIEAGWEKFDKDIATTYTKGFTIGEVGAELTIDITPILEDGTVLSPEALDNYLKTLDTTNGVQGLLASDKKNLVTNVREGKYEDDTEYWENYESQLTNIKEEYEEVRNQIKDMEDIAQQPIESSVNVDTTKAEKDVEKLENGDHKIEMTPEVDPLLQPNVPTLNTTATINADTSGLTAGINSANSELSSMTGTTLSIDADNYKAIQKANETTAKMNSIPDANPNVNVNVNGIGALQSAIDKIIQLKNKDGTNITITETTKKVTEYIKKTIEKSGGLNGNAHAIGNAFAGGTWGAPRTGKSLVGELG